MSGGVIEDWDMWVRLYRETCSRVLYVPDAGYLYRRHSGQTTANRTRRLVAKIETAMRHEQRYELSIPERELLLLMCTREELFLALENSIEGGRSIVNLRALKSRLASIPGARRAWGSLQETARDLMAIMRRA